MKVALGFKIVDGPWGGGNRFVRSLYEELTANGHTVVFKLDDLDIDFILLLDPRRRHPCSAFSLRDILLYLLLKNNNCILIHRINECDERKNTKFMNRLLKRVNYCSDHTVFVGSWLLKLDLSYQLTSSNYSIIRNGADPNFFNSRGSSFWDRRTPLKLVTHHWGGNYMKGFDIYKRIDDMLADSFWSKLIDFTYIGNLPRGFSFTNAKYLSPLDGLDLAEELRSHHGYITASINEPGGNHQNEGALCGLPLLYRDSGCLPEYCAGYGICFSESNFEAKLLEYIHSYQQLKSRMENYPYTSQRTSSMYVSLFERLIESREAITTSRRLLRNPLLLLRNFLMF